MDPSEANSYLESFTNFETQLHRLRPEDFNLDRIQRFLDLAGNPSERLRIIHVAGTKGKGSTCAFLAGILQEAGYKVGLYTSPHLHKVNERIRILNKDNLHSKDNFSGAITDDDLASVLTFLRPFAASIQNQGSILTYFEVLTVAALCYFSKAQVDVAILETGLGGRLDATNAVNSSIAVITPVSMDHVRILGATLNQIASEKAGIIKNSHQKVVIAPQEKEVMNLMLQRCREFGVHSILVYPEEYQHFKIGLKGKHQMVNAATAIEAAKILKIIGMKISDEAISDGVRNVQWPGRFELLRSAPDVIVDCAHNEASAQALFKTLIDEYPQQRVILILGISQDKDVAAICHHLKDRASLIFLTQANHPRAHLFTQAECKNHFGDKPFEITQSVSQALKQAFQIANTTDVILVTGSVFVVAEVRENLRSSRYVSI